MKLIKRFCIVAFCLLPLAVPAVGSRVVVDVTAGSGILPHHGHGHGRGAGGG